MSKDTVKPRDELLQVSQIEQDWPISAPTIWRQLKAGKFPAPVRVGRKCYWRRQDVEAYFTPQPRAA